MLVIRAGLNGMPQPVSSAAIAPLDVMFVQPEALAPAVVNWFVAVQFWLAPATFLATTNQK